MDQELNATIRLTIRRKMLYETLRNTPGEVAGASQHYFSPIFQERIRGLHRQYLYKASFLQRQSKALS